jgi:hypothetical protein
MVNRINRLLKLEIAISANGFRLNQGPVVLDKLKAILSGAEKVILGSGRRTPIPRIRPTRFIRSPPPDPRVNFVFRWQTAEKNDKTSPRGLIEDDAIAEFRALG